jgi:hypothetical protein
MLGAMVFHAASRSALPGAFLLSLLLPLLSCSPPAHRALYYWKTTQGPSRAEITMADMLGADRLYVRMFDVDAVGVATPALTFSAEERGSWTHGGAREVIPVVYIVNDALLRKGFQPADSARTLVAGVSRLWASDGSSWNELQIDCDWTPSSRGAYFELLQNLGRRLHAEGKTLSATIRLHQVRDRRLTGVPPVDRGMLMAYNLLPPDNAGERSSILDNDELAAYLASMKSYPLPLDAALPVFSWVAQWEGQRLIGLIDDAGAAAEVAGSGFARIGTDRFEARARGSLAGRSVEKGDVLVIDRPGPRTVREAAVMLRAALRSEARSVALFHLDADTVNSFSGGDNAQIEGLYAVLGAGRGRGFPAPRLRTRALGRRGGLRRERSTGLFLVVPG